MPGALGSLDHGGAQQWKIMVKFSISLSRISYGYSTVRRWTDKFSKPKISPATDNSESVSPGAIKGDQ